MYTCFYEVTGNNQVIRIDYGPAACLKADQLVMAGGSNVKVTKIEMEQTTTRVEWYRESIVYIPARQY